MHVLVESVDGKYLSELFAFLDQASPLDHYLAGYFEKVLEMLFRRMTVPVMSYLNLGGVDILRRFLKHMDNYSIMQIVQRLMLPHIPFSMATDQESIPPNERASYQCNWSFLEETCQLLYCMMLEIENSEVPAHISDLLITVLQLSPPEAVILSQLCQEVSLNALLASAIVDDADTASANDFLTPKASISLASISVLESLISRMCESAGPFLDDSSRDVAPEEVQILQHIRDSIDKVCIGVQPYLIKIAAQLKS